MSDVIDVLYRLRDMAGKERERLQAAVDSAQAVIDKLDKFALDAEESCELLAVSDLNPLWHSSIPDRSGLMFIDGRDKYGKAGD